jgi:hypothetical protein
MCRTIVNRGDGLVFFPEGTRAIDCEFLDPKPGIGLLATELQCPIVPCYLHGSNKFADVFWGREKHSIRYGEPITPEWIASVPKEKEGYQVIAEEVMKRIRGLQGMDYMIGEKEFRPVAPNELLLLRKLLDHDFAGRAEAVEQLNGLLVRELDDHGPVQCLELQPTSSVPLPFKNGLLAEASYVDLESSVGSPEGGRIVNILLHVVDHKLMHLEIYKNDQSQIFTAPDISRLQSSSYPPAKRDKPEK